MGYLHPDYAAADVAAALRADVNRVARLIAETMLHASATYTKVAATYRRMAGQRESDGLRFYQHAARLDQRAANARRFAQWERHQSNQLLRPPKVAKPAG